MNRLKHLIFAVVLTSTLTAAAQPPQGGRGGKRPDRTEWMRKMKQLKHEFIIKEIGLSAAQQKDFFAAYDAKENERFEAERSVRKAERELQQKANASEADYLSVINLQYELGDKINQIEKKYRTKFESILTKKQMFRLRDVERDFQKMLNEKRSQECPPPPHK